MNNRNLFSELSSALTEAKEHSEGKLTLKTHQVNDVSELNISPGEIVNIREQFNMSRGVFARLL
ncbi:MAG: transcriptional regulator, partial [Aestuariibacter sp.]|nr:transcriptional regulator [Aestuariibacter sp.]